MEDSVRTPGNKILKGSSRPTPKFFLESQPLSTKKERSGIKRHLPPRSPGRNCSHSKLSGIKGAPPRVPSFSDTDGSFHSYLGVESYFKKYFTVEGRLGVGSFGVVYKVKWKQDGNYYAVKCSKDEQRGAKDRRRWVEEARKLEKYTKHPNCVKFIQAWEENNNLYIQTELCSKSLAEFAEENHDIPERLIWSYLVDILQALKHLHDHDIIHLDVKPDNIFLTEDGVCKLGDFGLCVQSNNFDRSTVMDGDACYIPRELMQGHFTKAADVFSLGISILELSCDLHLPTGDSGWHQLRSGDIPTHLMTRISHDLQAVIAAMMAPDYRTRPTVDQVLNIPSVRRAVWERRHQVARITIKRFCNPRLLWGLILAFFWSCLLFPVEIIHTFTAFLMGKSCSISSPKTPKVVLTPDNFEAHSEIIYRSTPIKHSMPSQSTMSARKHLSPVAHPTFNKLRQPIDIGPRNLLSVFDMASSDEENS